MARKKKKSSPVPTEAKAFQDQLKQALEHFHDPEWLGLHSPLASSDFLGEYLLEREIDPSHVTKRGGVLRELLRSTVEELEEERESGEFYARLLRLSFLNPEELTGAEIARRLYIGRTTYFRDRKPAAIEALTATLLHRLKPALRLESPMAQPHLIGRDEIGQACLSALQAGQSVGLSGAGGVGKTALGQDIAAQIDRQLVPSYPQGMISLGRCFWFTFRLGLNDQRSSLLFALGHFLARQGASSLWAQLVTEQKGLDMNRALASLRYDLEGLAKAPPVLCFDEVDLLRPTELEAHASLLEFLKSLKGLTPLLFIGQQLPLEVEKAYHLSGLPASSVQAILKRADIELSAQEMTQLNSYTMGNPRLLELFMSLHRSGEEMSQLLAELESTPSLEFLLRRIWQRLSQPEQDMLAFLVPFRRPVPLTAWTEKNEQDAIQQLIARRLVQHQSQGQIALLPAFQNVLYNSLSTQARQTVHLRAATLRAKRGDYTPAAYHYLQAGEAQIAFRLWHAHQEQEINQGQAETALKIFEQLDPKQLTKKDQENLALLRAQLLKISGDYERSRQTVMTIEWDTPTLAAQAKRLEGDIAELKEELEVDMSAYHAGLQTVEQLLSEKAQFHKDLGWAAKRQDKLNDAWRQAILADYEAENLKGYVQERRGDYQKARMYYEEALALAEQANYDYGLANTCLNLGRLLTSQREFKLAEEYLETAYHYFKRRGQINKQASVRVNQALLWNFSRQYPAAIAAAKEALVIFERLGEPWGRDVARLNLAQAYLGAQELDNAEATAQQLMQGDARFAHYAWWVLGEVRLAYKLDQEAKELLERAIRFAEQHGNRVLEGYTQRSLGKLYRAISDNEAAQEAFERAIELFEGLNWQDEVAQTREEMGACRADA